MAEVAGRSTGIGVLFIGVPVHVLGFAGFLKLTDLALFAEAVSTWTLLPEWMLPVVVFGVPICEVGVAFAWHLKSVRSSRRWIGLLALLFVAVFSIVYVAHLLWSSVPNCGCFGVLARHAAALSEARGVLVRNAIMIASLGLGLWLARPSSLAMNFRPTPSRPLVRGRAFSLIEMIVVIAIVGLLIALLIPSLGLGVRTARRTEIAAKLRQHVASFTAYTSDYREYWPALTDPRADLSVIRGGGITHVTEEYFSPIIRWTIGLADGYYEGNAFSASFSFRGSEKLGTTLPDYLYSPTFLADPDYFDPETHQPGPGQWRATKVAEVSYPSAKGLFRSMGEELWIDVQDGPWPSDQMIGFVDGRAEYVNHDRLIRPAQTGGYAPFIHGPEVVSHTLRGVRGRDISR